MAALLSLVPCVPKWRTEHGLSAWLGDFIWCVLVAESFLLDWVVEGRVAEMEAVATAMYGKANLGILQLSCY